MKIEEIKDFLIDTHKKLLAFSAYSEIEKIRLKILEIIKRLEEK